MTKFQIASVTAVLAIVAGLLWYFFGTSKVGDSPVRVAGGSIELYAKMGWTSILSSGGWLHKEYGGHLPLHVSNSGYNQDYD